MYLARPNLPKPSCRVILVCGPPAAGKSTWVKTHCGNGDIVIDLDDIAQDFGFDSRDRPPSVTGKLLEERNRRMAQLSEQSPQTVAWVILSAPSKSLRAWWCEQLGVLPDDLILITPSRDELYRRIASDPSRRRVRDSHFKIVDEWFMREKYDDPGAAMGGCDPRGYPLDPEHSWNASKLVDMKTLIG